MNEIDKMLAELQANVEKELKNQKKIASTKKTTEKSPNNENDPQINDSFNELDIKVTFSSEDFVFVEGDEAKEIKDFYMCKHTVTQKEYLSVMGKNPSYFQHNNPTFKKKDKKYIKNKLDKDTSDYPVECVSLYDAVEFCNELNIKEGFAPCYEIDKQGSNNIKWIVKCDWTANCYRLPTDAEWEYAARGGKFSKMKKYAGNNTLVKVGWYQRNSDEHPHSVMKKNPNELGLYDMSGNVCEWVWDTSHIYRQIRGSSHIRGGNYQDDACYCEVDYCRYGYNADFYSSFLGFRIVRTFSK